MPAATSISLEDLALAVYAALDDALTAAGIIAHDGKLIPRRGPAPEMDDREVLCLAILQELLGFESDHKFHCWLEVNPLMKELFPKRLSRQNFADRRALLTPLIARLSGTLADLHGEARPPFSSSIPIPSTYAAPRAPAKVIRPDWEAWRKLATAQPLSAGFTACAST
jgi:hypothetical protein